MPSPHHDTRTTATTTSTTTLPNDPTPYKQVQTLKDGTVRHTIATKTIPSSVSEELPLPSSIRYPSRTTWEDPEDACVRFDAAASIFRTTTHRAIMALTQHLSRYVGAVSSTTPSSRAILQVISARNDNEKEEHEEQEQHISSIDTFYDVVQNGIHLEHFHSYVVPTKMTSTTSPTDSTLQLHTDQGLFHFCL